MVELQNLLLSARKLDLSDEAITAIRDILEKTKEEEAEKLEITEVEEQILNWVYNRLGDEIKRDFKGDPNYPHRELPIDVQKFKEYLLEAKEDKGHFKFLKSIKVDPAQYIDVIMRALPNPEDLYKKMCQYWTEDYPETYRIVVAKDKTLGDLINWMRELTHKPTVGEIAGWLGINYQKAWRDVIPLLKEEGEWR